MGPEVVKLVLTVVEVLRNSDLGSRKAWCWCKRSTILSAGVRMGIDIGKIDHPYSLLQIF